MSNDYLKRDWEILKAKVKRKWGELTDDDIDQISGRKKELVKRLQNQYGFDQQEAEIEVKNFEKEIDLADYEQKNQP